MSLAVATRSCLLAVLLAAVFAPQARATSFELTVGREGADTVEVVTELVEISPGVFTATGTGTEPGVFSLTFDLRLEGDPAISGSFTLVNLSGATQTFSVSATLGVAAIPAPTLIGGSFGDLAYTDLNQDGLVRVATVGGGFFYQALIDGISVQDLGAFDLGPTSGVLAKQSFGVPIPSAAGPGVTTSIGVGFPAFSLTAGDQIETPFELVVVVPEPAPGAMLTLGLFVLARAGKRRA
jgi:hypothetical protein